MIKRINRNVRVNRGVSGSFCVIEFPRSPWGVELYIDARADRRQPNYTFIEVVINGFVKFRECTHNTEAPERLIDLTKFVLNGGTFANPITGPSRQATHRPASRSGSRILMERM